MTARLGMANLILELRTFCNAAVGDYTVNAVSYFTDDQLQNELDAVMQVYRLIPLDFLPQRIGSAFVFKEYTVLDYIPLWLEEDTSGTTAWAVRDINGNAKVVTTDYSVNYRAGLITFVADQVASAAFFLDCRAFDMYRAAANVWRQKAGFESRSVDWSNADHKFSASQRRDYCLQQAAEFERKTGIRAVNMYRSDEV